MAELEERWLEHEVLLCRLGLLVLQLAGGSADEERNLLRRQLEAAGRMGLLPEGRHDPL